MNSLLGAYLIVGLLIALFSIVSGKNDELLLLGFFGRLFWTTILVIGWFPLFIVALLLVLKERRG